MISDINKFEVYDKIINKYLSVKENFIMIYKDVIITILVYSNQDENNRTEIQIDKDYFNDIIKLIFEGCELEEFLIDYCECELHEFLTLYRIIEKR